MNKKLINEYKTTEIITLDKTDPSLDFVSLEPALCFSLLRYDRTLIISATVNTLIYIYTKCFYEQFLIVLYKYPTIIEIIEIKLDS